MKSQRWMCLILAMLLAVTPFACKHSGMAVTNEGQLLKINLDVPADLSDGETKELIVSVSNRGVSKMGGVQFEVEIPNELTVLSHVAGRGIEWTESRTSSGTRFYQYNAGDVEVASEADVKFHVRANFGALDRSGDIKVTAWAPDLPGGKLIETKYIKVRR